MRNWIVIFIWIAQAFYLRLLAQKSVVWENTLVRHSISWEHQKIVPQVYIKALQKNVLVIQDTLPYFEFCLNNQMISSSQPVWIYYAHYWRKLPQGGEELTIKFVHQKIKHLQITISRQYFYDSPLIREQLAISNQSARLLHLSEYNQKLHFRFPQYVFENEEPYNKTREIRIASFARELLPNLNPYATYDDRALDNAEFFNLSHNHFFHPHVLHHNLVANSELLTKGCMQFLELANFRIFMSYEHAGQDSRRGFKKNGGGRIGLTGSFTQDAWQGVSGESGLPETDNDFWFIGIRTQKTARAIAIRNEYLKGAYLDKEPISVQRPYESVWSAFAIISSQISEKQLLHEYLWRQITEHPAARKQHFYYNTWGMQRDARNEGKEVREIFTEERMLEEIEYAAQLGVDIVVLDDGWQTAQGVWISHPTRLPNGLQPLVQKMKSYQIIPGIWLSPLGIDSTTERFRKYRHWIIEDKNGNPVKAQWEHPAFDFVSDFYHMFVNDCKKLIDEGFLFFKWDAISTLSSTLMNAHHGDNRYPKIKIKERYEYLLPIYITKAMRELRLYNPNVVIEIDVTEPERSLVGLLPLQEGKFFWINNGASGYGDYSHYRTKSVRTVLHVYDSILPYGIFTFAVYPHNSYPFFAQRYNVNTALIGGKGFWGNLKLMSLEQRQRVKNVVLKHKRILPYIEHLPLEIFGKIGSSPEIFVQLNRDTAAGQIIGFSGAPTEYLYKTSLAASNCLAVLHHQYELKEDTLYLPLQFSMPDDTREAFVLPNHGTNVSVTSVKGWLSDAILEEKRLILHTGTSSVIELQLPQNVQIVELKNAEYEQMQYNYYKIYTKAEAQVVIFWK
ncbi:MAG: alpha-galactosidase [Cytophagales bacterium]|nr:alpha-galactosidase [Cytophagales bacterium]MDW8384996.1 alpha-galactosidase [Flammeovirgaceae bacterium]